MRNKRLREAGVRKWAVPSGVLCDCCGKNETVVYNGRRSKFCSNACRAESNRETRVCQWCAAEFRCYNKLATSTCSKTCQAAKTKKAIACGPIEPSTCRGCGCRYANPKKGRGGGFCSMACYRANPSGFIKAADHANGVGSQKQVERYVRSLPQSKYEARQLAEHHRRLADKARSRERMNKKLRKAAAKACVDFVNICNQAGRPKQKRSWRKRTGECYQCGCSVGGRRVWCSNACRSKYIKKSVHKELSRKVKDAVYDACGGVCTYCNRKTIERWHRHDPMSPEIDHMTPPKLGGTDDMSNLTCSCRGCNNRKSDMPLDEWMMVCNNATHDNMAGG